MGIVYKDPNPTVQITIKLVKRGLLYNHYLIKRSGHIVLYTDVYRTELNFFGRIVDYISNVIYMIFDIFQHWRIKKLTQKYHSRIIYSYDMDPRSFNELCEDISELGINIKVTKHLFMRDKDALKRIIWISSEQDAIQLKLLSNGLFTIIKCK